MAPKKTCAVAAALFVLCGGPAGAQSTQADNRQIDSVVVWGRATDLIGKAEAASEGVVGYADFETRPIGRAGELVEVIPGVIATQHSGEGKANQYFLRGFNLDHGTDFSASIDGVPINLRTHGHGQGYLDLNFIIPEVVEKVEFKKGPYSAFSGDFGAAGSSAFVIRDTLDHSFVEATAGENGYLRGVGAASMWLGQVNTLLAVEGETYAGPWDRPADLSKVNAIAKLSRKSETLEVGAEFLAYASHWKSTDQIPLRAVESGLIDRLGNIDNDVGGRTSRYTLIAHAKLLHGSGASTTLQVYGVNYDLNLTSDFTYFLEDPVNGDEFRQVDRRWIYGGRIEHDRMFDVLGRTARLRVGADTRIDDIRDIGLFRSGDGVPTSPIREDRVKESSVSAYGEVQIPVTDRVRAAIGARGDYYHANVDARTLAENGGSAHDSLFSPSVALAWRALDALELYANYGEGFHSNDVRGTTITVDPVTGDPADRVPILVPAKGAELGARFEKGPVNATLSAFWLDLDGELVFVGDAGTTEPNAPSRRYGAEASVFWEATDWLVLDGSAAYTDAKFRDVPSDENHIPGAVKSVLSIGAVRRWGPLTTSIRLRQFGKAPLIEDASVASKGTTLVNLGATYDFGPNQLKVDIFNLFDSDDNDITYFYESQLRGEAAPVEDVHFHPVEPRQIRVSFRRSF